MANAVQRQSVCKRRSAVWLRTAESMATILIMEDRAPDRRLLTAAVRTQRHEIVEASDGKEAPDTLAEMRPDVVINDILTATVDRSECVRS